MARTLIQIELAITTLLKQIKNRQTNREISLAQLDILRDDRAQKEKARAAAHSS